MNNIKNIAFRNYRFVKNRVRMIGQVDFKMVLRMNFTHIQQIKTAKTLIDSQIVVAKLIGYKRKKIRQFFTSFRIFFQKS